MQDLILDVAEENASDSNNAQHPLLSAIWSECF